MTLVDAGPLIALLDCDDVDHRRCVRVLPNLTGPLLTTWPTFTEAVYLLGERAGWRGQDKLWQLVFRDDLEVATVEGPTLRRTHELMGKYRDLPMDLADASLVALAEKKKLTRIFTLDRDFRVYRMFGRKPFTLVP